MPTSTTELKDRLPQADEIELGVIGRKSGRKISRPVWFVVEENTLYLLPVTGSDTKWYKNLLKDRRIWISVDGVEAQLEGTPVTDPKVVASVVDKFRQKYGEAEVKKYYSKFDVAVIVNLD